LYLKGMSSVNYILLYYTINYGILQYLAPCLFEKFVISDRVLCVNLF